MYRGLLPVLALALAVLPPVRTHAQVDRVGAVPLPAAWSHASASLHEAWRVGDREAMARLLATGATLHDGRQSLVRTGEILDSWLRSDGRRASRRRSSSERAAAHPDSLLESVTYGVWAEPRDCVVPVSYDAKDPRSPLRAFSCRGGPVAIHHVEETGSYRVLWKRQTDGAWRVQRIDLARLR